MGVTGTKRAFNLKYLKLFLPNYFLIAGDLRVCTYCCKVVLSYLQSSDMRSDLSADLKALQEDLQIKYGSESPPAVRKTTTDQDEDEVPAYRKPSVGYMEEKYALRRYYKLVNEFT